MSRWLSVLEQAINERPPVTAAQVEEDTTRELDTAIRTLEIRRNEALAQTVHPSYRTIPPFLKDCGLEEEEEEEEEEGEDDESDLEKDIGNYKLAWCTLAYRRYFDEYDLVHSQYKQQAELADKTLRDIENERFPLNPNQIELGYNEFKKRVALQFSPGNSARAYFWLSRTGRDARISLVFELLDEMMHYAEFAYTFSRTSIGPLVLLTKHLCSSCLEEVIKAFVGRFPESRWQFVQEKYYVCAAVQRFFFLASKLRNERITLRGLLTSAVLKEFLDTQRHKETVVWFTFEKQAMIFSAFTTLAPTGAQTLTSENFYAYGDHAYTPLFIRRITEALDTNRGRFYYDSFVQFVLVVENLGAMSSLPYVWKVLDLHENGRVTAQTLQILYKDKLQVVQELCPHVLPPPHEHMVIEVFDAVNPSTPGLITYQDLARCTAGARDGVFNLLFHIYSD